jgi:hypothetical protein
VIISLANAFCSSWLSGATRCKTPRFWRGWMSHAIIWQISRTCYYIK